MLGNGNQAGSGQFRLMWQRPDDVTETLPASALRARNRRDYYSFGGAVVAMREGVPSTAAIRPMTYLFGDHLGSSSLATNASGAVVAETRYKPYGEIRWSSGALPTDFGYTGQRLEKAGYVGSLMDYKARAYSPALGRFVSADTIVPGAGNGQALNRYMYVLANPLALRDPSGHISCDDCDGRDEAERAASTPVEFRVKFDESARKMTYEDKVFVQIVMESIGRRHADDLNSNGPSYGVSRGTEYSAKDAFRLFYGNDIVFVASNEWCECYGSANRKDEVVLYYGAIGESLEKARNPRLFVVHEMGHQLVHQIGGRRDTSEFATATFVAKSGKVEKLSNRLGLSDWQGGHGDAEYFADTYLNWHGGTLVGESGNAKNQFIASLLRRQFRDLGMSER